MSEEKIRHINPLNRCVTPGRDRDGSDYPDTVKVPMEDGNVITYRRVIEQPHPQCLKTIEIIRIMAKHTYGGTKKKPADAATPNRPRRKIFHNHYTSEQEKRE